MLVFIYAGSYTVNTKCHLAKVMIDIEIAKEREREKR